MNFLRSLPTKPQILILLCVFSSPLMLAERPSTANGRQSSQQSETNHAAIYTDQDSYQIYAALLESEKHTLYVIRAEIHGYADLTTKNLGIEGDKEFMRDWGPVMDDYAKQNRTAKLLQRNLPLRTSYKLIPESNIFPAEHGQDWDDYYRRYPSSGGYYWFSAVGFNPTRTRAIVDMGHECGILCGNGGPHFFEKRDGKWCEVSVRATMRVWTS
ncbi:MAG TPA: hypothetical protein VNB49_15460 [Candidatus Dormibacteraeota bacterium]|nr:hypothetical protein [Candidatus Dormibacteraeota bacterium]